MSRYIKGKNGVASLYNIRDAVLIEPKAIIISYEKDLSTSLFGEFNYNRVRIEFGTEEDANKALLQIIDTCK